MNAATKSAKKPKAAKEAKRKKPAKPKQPKPEMIKVDKLEWDHHQKCRELAEEIEKLQSEYNSLKETAKEIKEAWKAAPLRESLHKPGDAVLTKALDTLHKAKVSTIGKLEELRATGRQWFKGKGIKQDAADAVTDAVVAWLSKHRDAAVLAEARNGAAGKKADELVPVHAPKKKAAKRKVKAK